MKIQTHMILYARLLSTRPADHRRFLQPLTVTNQRQWIMITTKGSRALNGWDSPKPRRAPIYGCMMIGRVSPIKPRARTSSSNTRTPRVITHRRRRRRYGGAAGKAVVHVWVGESAADGGVEVGPLGVLALSLVGVLVAP